MTHKMQNKFCNIGFMKICATHKRLIPIYKKLFLTMPTHSQLISIYNMYLYLNRAY